MINYVDPEGDEVVGAFEDMLRSSVALICNLEPNAEKFINRYTDLAQSGSFEFFKTLPIESKDDMRILARVFAIQIWNNTPLPSNHYQPKRLTEPKRNDPCFCGSGKKFKQCCAHINIGDLSEAIQQDLLTSYLLEIISQKDLKQAWQFLPHDLLGFIGSTWGRDNEILARRALMMLEPIFKQEDSKLNHRDELALDALAELYTRFGNPRKKKVLIQRMVEHKDKALQVAALHRLCCIYGDQGDDEAAWQTFQKVQRLAPNDVNLSHLEILLLMQQGKFEQMRQRGNYWIKRLTAMNHNGELDAVIGIISDMTSEAAPGMLGDLMDNNLPGIARLVAWLQQSVAHPQPSLHKLVQDDDMLFLEPKNRQAASLIKKWQKTVNHYGEDDDFWDDPDPWLTLLEITPELAGSTDVLDHLVYLTYDLEGPNPLVTFRNLINLIVIQSKALLPLNPQGEFAWGIMENRPMIRLIAHAADSLNSLGEHEQSLELWQWLLRLNPNDNTGARARVITGLLRLKRDNEALAICEQFSEDSLVDVSYGHVLTLFRLGEKDRAKTRLHKAMKHAPGVISAITNKTMKEPEGIMPGFTAVGGADEAWQYRQEARDVWLSTPGAVDWLKQQGRALKGKK